MNIVFLNGPFHQSSFSRCSRSPAVTKSGTLYYPIWLAYAAGLAQEKTNYSVHLVDAIPPRWNQEQLISHLRQIQPDLVCCDTSTPSISQDLRTARAVRQAFPDTRIVMVGTHATALPESVLASEPAVDAVAAGEYDQTAIDLACAMDQNRPWENVPGLVLRRQEQFHYTAARNLIDNLDSFPFVSRVYQRSLNLQDYFFSAARFPMVMMITSRGCPHRCQWCLYPQVMHRGKYRLRSPENVAAEFEYIARDLPAVREIGIEDDLFTGDRRRLQQICELLIHQKNTIPFWCDTRVDLDYETMRLLKAAGCRLLIAGFESASQEILDRISKGASAEQAFEFVRNARRAGLLVHGCFVLGNPGETHQTVRQTIRFAKQLHPDTAQFFPMMVYPGTKMYNWVRDNGCLRTEDFDRWLTPDGLHNSVVDLPGLPAEQVLQYCDRARREFYLRKGYIAKKIAQSLFSPQEARRNLKAFRRFARFLVRSA